MDSNPFLRVVKANREGGGGPTHIVFVNNEVHVEIFYTEDISLTSGQLKSIQSFGTGSSVFGGKFKYSELPI